MHPQYGRSLAINSLQRCEIFLLAACASMMWGSREIFGDADRAVHAPLTVRPAAAAEWQASDEFRETLRRIEELARTANLTDAQKQNHLEQLEAMGYQIEQKWRQADVEAYARLTWELCGHLGGFNGRGLRAQYLAQHFALRALEKADYIPLEVECQLARASQWELDAAGKALPEEANIDLRKKQAMVWLHGWRRIEDTIDANWDPADTGTLNVSPPGDGPAGMDPEGVADPRLRAQYKAAIEANRQKNQRATLQHRARDLKKHWIPDAKRFLIRRYMQPPDGANELRTLLEQYGTDADARAQVLDAVKNKTMPRELMHRNTTQPAK